MVQVVEKPTLPPANLTPSRWDVFCQVVDNYGDIGVCWRLARQLAGEFGLELRLWVDEPEALDMMLPSFDPALESQSHAGVEVRRWPVDFPPVVAADVVIEAFGCELPPAYLAAMVTRPVRPPLWINLEYLSAEDWVHGCHALPSPHPKLPLVKHFYFPGFTSQTGGLLRESGLLGQRDAFWQSPQEKAAFWASLGCAVPTPETVTVSLFCYPNPALPGLLGAWAEAGYPVFCLVPEGKPAAAVAEALGVKRLVAGDRLRRGDLEILVLPFVRQEDYDRLLWACDCNFVRGEDSFVRAQWAARPFVWHIYPQEELAHEKKLAAFLDRYCAALPADAAEALRGMWWGWNRGEVTARQWADFWAQRAVLECHALDWAARQEGNGDLATSLVNFSNAMIE